jgi:hypothetical protein
MALTKVIGSGVEGISNASNATFLTATAAEGVTLAGTLAVTGVHTVGTNAVATSEGGAVTQNLLQGLCKAWTTFNGTGTIATTDSHNIGSLTDTATGVYRTNFTNAFGNAEHPDAFAYREGTSTSGGDIDRSINYNRVAQTTGHTSLTTQSGGTTPIDVARIAVMTFGDLA